jgi:tetratricopeptide (TPR) repeat protein
MKAKKMLTVAIFVLFMTLQGCATVPPAPPEKTAAVPLKEVNLQEVLEENAGLEIAEQDVKDARDFYRAGVQKKSHAEKDLEVKKYDEAIKLFETSNYLFSRLFQYIDTDYAHFFLFEETDVIFIPNLLSADNYLKIGDIDRALGRASAAQRNWKKALSFVRKSLATEQTEWGLSLEREVGSRLAASK